MSTTQNPVSTKTVIGPVRFSYAHVWEPTAMQEGDQKKFSVALLIPKSDKALVAKIQAAIDAATEQGKTNKWGGKIPPKFQTPLRDGDAERPDDEIYANHFFINAKSGTRPGIVDVARNPIVNRDEFYSGCYGFASVNFFPFDNKSKGVAAGLNNLMKTKDGEALGGRDSAENDFAEIEVEADDLLG